MEDENYSSSEGTSKTNKDKSLKETFQSGSPDEVRDKVKGAVEKGVAAVAGALKGFNKETERSDLPEKTKTAVHQAAETTKSAVSSITQEAKGLKEPLRDASAKLRETASDMKSTFRGEIDKTKGAVGGAAGSTSASDRTSSSYPSTTSYGGPQVDRPESTSMDMGMGGSELGARDTSPELPDISHTPMAQSDKKLIGKDLAEDIDDK